MIRVTRTRFLPVAKGHSGPKKPVQPTVRSPSEVRESPSIQRSKQDRSRRGARSGEVSEIRTATSWQFAAWCDVPGDKRSRSWFHSSAPPEKARRNSFRRTPVGVASTSEAARGRHRSRSGRHGATAEGRQWLCGGGAKPGDEQRIIFQAGKPAGTTGGHTQDADTGLRILGAESESTPPRRRDRAVRQGTRGSGANVFPRVCGQKRP